MISNLYMGVRKPVIEYLLNKSHSMSNSNHLQSVANKSSARCSQCNHLLEENATLHKNLSHNDNEIKDETILGEQMDKQNDQVRENSFSPNTASKKPDPSVEKNGGEQKTSQNSQETEEDAILRAEIAKYREQNAQLLEEYKKINEEMKRKKIDSFEALAESDKAAMKVLIDLARNTPPAALEGNNIGFFGITSTGKSTMLNALIGEKVAETGVGETTTQIKSYNGIKTNFILWDIPGRNDEVSYFSMEYISFFKGLTRRLILIQATVKENSSMMKLLDEIGLNYDIIFNKFDKVDEDEQEQMKKQIANEIQKIGLKGVNKTYFVSAKNPKMFNDWMDMIYYLENI